MCKKGMQRYRIGKFPVDFYMVGKHILSCNTCSKQLKTSRDLAIRLKKFFYYSKIIVSLQRKRLILSHINKLLSV